MLFVVEFDSTNYYSNVKIQWHEIGQMYGYQVFPDATFNANDDQLFTIVFFFFWINNILLVNHVQCIVKT